MFAVKTNEQKLIAAGISRVSLERQVDNYSLETQAKKLEALGEQYGFIVPDEYLIEDDGYQGSDFNRPSIKRVCNLIKQGKVQAVVFPYLDRFARNVKGGLNLIDTFQDLGAKVLFGEHGWFSDKVKMQVQFGLVIAEAQKDSINLKSRDATLTKLRNGFAHGGKSPFGWHFVTAAELNFKAMQEGKPLARKPANVHEPVPADQQAYTLMCDLMLAGHSLRSICRELMQRGIKSPGGRVRWNATTVLAILKNPCYHTGIWYWNKRESIAIEVKKRRKPNMERHKVKDGFKFRPEKEWISQPLKGGAIISAEKWEAVQEALARNGKLKVGKPAKEGGFSALLKGMVKCGACGFSVAPWQKTRPKIGVRAWYKCTNRDRVTGKHLCNELSITAEKLETAVWGGLVSALTNDLPALVKAYQESSAGLQEAEDVTILQATEAKLVEKLQRAVDGAIDSDTEEEKQRYQERASELKGELKLIRRRIAAALESREEVTVDYASIARCIRKVCDTQDRGVQRQTLADFVLEIRYAGMFAEVTLRVPLAVAGKGVNCSSPEPQINNYISLKVKVSLAA